MITGWWGVARSAKMLPPAFATLVGMISPEPSQRPLSLDDLGETDPTRAEAYADAIAEATTWVEEQARLGNSDLFFDVVLELTRIQKRRGLPDGVWEFLDWDSLYFAAVGA